MLDVLTHLPLFASVDEARAHLDQCARDGVTDLICAGTEPRTDGVLAPARLPVGGLRVHRAFGIHPRHASDEHRADQMHALAAHLQGAIAIGECGLDKRCDAPLVVQEQTLRAQLALARARALPVILHLVGAWSRALEVIAEDGPLPAGGVWHAFAGPKDGIERAQSLGLAFSIGGLVLDPRARRLHDALPHIPTSLLVVETDMPHQPPVRLAAVVDALARVHGRPSADVARQTHANACRIFGIPS